jgi:hypothetical protein
MKLLDNRVQNKAVWDVKHRLEKENYVQHDIGRPINYAAYDEQKLDEHHKDDRLVVTNPARFNLAPLIKSPDPDCWPDKRHQNVDPLLNDVSLPAASIAIEAVFIRNAHL